MKKQELKEYLANVNTAGEAKSKLPGMIHQVWEDGKHTCQKCGDLLWMRTLHMFDAGFDKSVPLDIMPVQDGQHAYCFCETDTIANEVRAKMKEYFNSNNL